MFFVVQRSRLLKMLDIARDDRRRKIKTDEIPYLRIAATADNQIRVTGLTAEGSIPATVHEPGVLFIRAAPLREFIAMEKGERMLAVQASSGGVEFDNVRMPTATADFLLYADPATAPEHHPGDRQRAAIASDAEIAEARKRVEAARDKVVMAAETLLAAEEALHKLLGTKPDARRTLASLLDGVTEKPRQRRRRR